MRALTLEGLKDKLRLRKRGYQQIFAPGAPGHSAMKDLAQFCRAFGNDIIIGDHDRTLILAGRREAFYRIVEHLELEPDELIELYKSNVRGDEE